MSKFRLIDRSTGSLLPPSVDEWLPQWHMARFVVDVIDGIDVSALTQGDRGAGAATYHPSLLLAVLMYGYATGVFSSRKLERATYDSIAFRFIASNKHPDHETIAAFRRKNLKDIEGHLLQLLLLAREVGMPKIGRVGLEESESFADSSLPSAIPYEQSALSYEDGPAPREPTRIEAQLRAEVAGLLAKAEAADRADLPDGMVIPDALLRSKDRFGKIAEARGKIAARAARQAAREAKVAATGKTVAAKTPRPTDPSANPSPAAPPKEGPRGKAAPVNPVQVTNDKSRVEAVPSKLDIYLDGMSKADNIGRLDTDPEFATPSQDPSPPPPEPPKRAPPPAKPGIFELLAGFGKMLMAGKEKKPAEVQPAFENAGPALIARKQELSVEFFRKKNEMTKAAGTAKYKSLEIELNKIQEKQGEVNAELDRLIDLNAKKRQAREKQLSGG